MFKGSKKNYKIIGIIAAAIQKEYVKDIAMSVSREAIARGYKVMLFCTYHDLFHDTMFTKGESSIFKLAGSELLDAVVLLPESVKSPAAWEGLLRDTKAMGIPLLCIDRNVEGCSSIVFDYKSAFEGIVRHVVEHHRCRRVNFIAGIKGNSFSEERVECYKKVLAENGIEFEEKRLGYGDFWEIPTKQVMEDFFESGLELPEAIICCNDVAAITACKCLKSRGYNVPEDVIVTGFDGIELERYTVPRLTTAAADIHGMSVQAMNILDSAIAGVVMPDVTVIPYRMRLSHSCGCKVGSVTDINDKIMELYNRINNSLGHETHMFAYVFHAVELRDMDTMGDIMVRYADLYTWCCLNSDFISDKREKRRYNEYYTETMHLLARCDNGKLTKHIDFPAKDMLPDMEDVLEEHNILMFLPLHFQEEIMGYCAVSINTESFNFDNTHRFINNTNQIFENLKNRVRLQQAYAEMEEMHLRDPMTGVYNRRGFYKSVAELGAKYGSSKKYLLFSADLDGLKSINDSHGHLMGDAAIVETSAAMSSYDDEAVCARFGGDEFVAVMAVDDAEGFKTDYMAHIDSELADYNSRSGLPFEVSLSIGAADLAGVDVASIEEAMKEADKHMYKTKKQRHKDAAAKADL